MITEMLETLLALLKNKATDFISFFDGLGDVYFI